jgi:hypothetical protein
MPLTLTPLSIGVSDERLFSGFDQFSIRLDAAYPSGVSELTTLYQTEARVELFRSDADDWGCSIIHSG